MFLLDAAISALGSLVFSRLGISAGFYWSLFFWLRLPPPTIPTSHCFGWTTLIFFFFVGMMEGFLPYPAFWLFAVIAASIGVPFLY